MAKETTDVTVHVDAHRLNFEGEEVLHASFGLCACEVLGPFTELKRGTKVRLTVEAVVEAIKFQPIKGVADLERVHTLVALEDGARIVEEL